MTTTETAADATDATTEEDRLPRRPWRRVGSDRLGLWIAGAAALVALVMVLQPTHVTSTDASGQRYASECGIEYFVRGAAFEQVTADCRGSFAKRGYTAVGLAAALAFIGAELAIGRRTSRGDSPEQDGDVPEPGAKPGVESSLRRGVTIAGRQAPFRLLCALALGLALVGALVLRPGTVTTVDAAGVARLSDCRIQYLGSGAKSDEVHNACREAFTGRATALAIVIFALAATIGLLIHYVQYWRGFALGAMWSKDSRRRAALSRIATGWAAVVVVALVLASTTRVGPLTSTSAAASESEPDSSLPEAGDGDGSSAPVTSSPAEENIVSPDSTPPPGGPTDPDLETPIAAPPEPEDPGSLPIPPPLPGLNQSLALAALDACGVLFLPETAVGLISGIAAVPLPPLPSVADAIGPACIAFGFPATQTVCPFDRPEIPIAGAAVPPPVGRLSDLIASVEDQLSSAGVPSQNLAQMLRDSFGCEITNYP